MKIIISSYTNFATTRSLFGSALVADCYITISCLQSCQILQLKI